MRVQLRVHGGPERAGGARSRRASTGCALDADDVTYFLGRETIIVTKTPGMAHVARAAVRADGAQRRPRDRFFRLPPERVVELGVQVEI